MLILRLDLGVEKTTVALRQNHSSSRLHVRQPIEESGMARKAGPKSVVVRPEAEPGSWLTFPGFALFLGLLILLSFPLVVLGLETFVTRDFGHFAYPLAFYQRHCFWRGELPMWDPYNDCGIPFLAQWNTMPLYPPALFYLIFPLGWSLSAFCLLHLWFAGAGMYVLARRWTASRLGAAVAGLVFAFNGLSVSSLMWPSNMATLSWMPWVVLLAERAWREGGRTVIFAGIAGALQVLAGGPETIAFTWMIVGSLWCAEFLRQRPIPGNPSPSPTPKPALALPLRLAGTLAVTLALSAAQLLPTLDLILHSQRERGFGGATWSLPLRGWVNFLVPPAFQQSWLEGVGFQTGQGWVSSFYLGTVTLVLAAAALKRRSARVWVLMIVSVIAYVFSAGGNTPVFAWLEQVVPVLSLMRYPVKFIILIIFTAPLMAAIGMKWLTDNRQDPAPKRQKQLLVIAGILLALIGAVLWWASNSNSTPNAETGIVANGLARAGFLVATIVLLLLLMRKALPQATPVVVLLLLFVIWLDLKTHAPVLNSTVPPAVYEPGIVRKSLALTPEPRLGQSRVMISPAADLALDRLPGKTVEQGLLARRLGYFSDLNLLDLTPKIDGFFALYPREISHIISTLYASTNVSLPRIQDFLGVSHETAPGEFTAWQARNSFLPLVTAGQKPLFLDETNTVKGMLQPDFDSTKVAFLPPEAAPLVSANGTGSVAIVSQEFQASRIDLTVNATAPALVVIAQTYFHRWRAYVDGQPQPLFRANYAFQALQVPAGKHSVGVHYEDTRLRLGMAISVAGALFCVIVLHRSKPKLPILSSRTKGR